MKKFNYLSYNFILKDPVYVQVHKCTMSCFDIHFNQTDLIKLFTYLVKENLLVSVNFFFSNGKVLVSVDAMDIFIDICKDLNIKILTEEQLNKIKS